MSLTVTTTTLEHDIWWMADTNRSHLECVQFLQGPVKWKLVANQSVAASFLLPGFKILHIFSASSLNWLTQSTDFRSQWHLTENRCRLFLSISWTFNFSIVVIFNSNIDSMNNLWILLKLTLILCFVLYVCLDEKKFHYIGMLEWSHCHTMRRLVSLLTIPNYYC